MRLKIVLIFLLSILIPTALLAYFGLQAVRSERSIVERSMKERYEATADIIEGEIDSTLSVMSPELLKNKALVESIILDQASIFKGQALISDEKGAILGGADRKDMGKPMVTRHLKKMPYSILVYEKYPVLMERYENRKKALYFYITIIMLSVVLILAGGLFTLNALSKQWALAELKSEFVSGLSHDLRRPLTSIRMFSEMLKDNIVSTEEKKREYYTAIHSESERLTQLANNILDFSRIESGRKEGRFKNENIGKLVRESVDYFLSYNTEEAHPITVVIQEGLPTLKMDSSAISQAILNLLSNAAKYSDPGQGINVVVRKRMNDIVVEVIDKGVGIPPGEQKKIFRKFYRVHRGDSDVEGSGLGLALVKYAAEVHGGRVHVESEVGVGSKFSLVLPV
jgi:signal transduction histidine kinase